MNTSIRLGVVLIAMWSFAENVSAQTQLGPGTRVRVFEAARSIVGTLDAIDDQTITFRKKPDSEPVTLDRSKIVRLEVSRKPSRRKVGALIGGAVGVVAGVAFAAAQDCQPEQDFLNICKNTKNNPGYYAFAAVVLGAAGAGLGALVAPGEKWESVTAVRPHVAVWPSRGGVRIGVSLAF